MAETIWNSAVSVYHFMMDNLVVINILLSLVIVFFQRRSPQTVWTWLLLLYFIPILGFVLYLLIGQDFHKSRMFKAKEIEGEIKYAVRRQEETIYRRRLRLTNPAVARYRDLILYNLEAGQAVLTDNNDVRIYTDGKEKFKALLEEMQKAKKYIAVNMSANILGMGNAATPMGIKAMQCLDKENNNPLYTSKNMCTLVVLNTTSVQLIPTTIIALRVAAGSANPFSVILPIWISSFTAAFIALTLTKLLYRE